VQIDKTLKTQDEKTNNRSSRPTTNRPVRCQSIPLRTFARARTHTHTYAHARARATVCDDRTTCTTTATHTPRRAHRTATLFVYARVRVGSNACDNDVPVRRVFARSTPGHAPGRRDSQEFGSRHGGWEGTPRQGFLRDGRVSRVLGRTKTTPYLEHVVPKTPSKT